jgi:hypothetical protein
VKQRVEERVRDRDTEREKAKQRQTDTQETENGERERENARWDFQIIYMLRRQECRWAK